MDTTGKTIPRQVAQAGQGLVEYALILALIAVLAISATLFLGAKINTVLSNVGNSVAGQVSTQTTSSSSSSSSTNQYPQHDGWPCDSNGHHWDYHWQSNTWSCH